MSWATKDKNTGFNRSSRAIPIELRVKVYNYWKPNSIISVDRRNGRHQVRISKEKMRYLCQDIPDDDISSVPTKQGIKFEGHCHIYTKPVRNLHACFISENSYISYVSFLALKPFYIFPPTEKEKESCMCPTGLNIHVIYDVLRKNVKLPSSLSQFLTADFNCEVDSTINYHRLDCLSSECGNGCKIMNKSNEIFRNVDVKKLHSFRKSTHILPMVKRFLTLEQPELTKKEILSSCMINCFLWPRNMSFTDF